MRKRVCYSSYFSPCELHIPCASISSFFILRDKVNALKFNKAIKKL